MGKGAENMPRLLHARAPQDMAEEQKVRKLANSRHAPADWIMRARMIVRSWDGLRTKTIAEELGCHPQTVRERFHRFNAQGIDGLGDLPGAGRKPRITEAERSRIIALVATDPPGIGWCEVLAASWRPQTKSRKLIGQWMPLPPPLGKEASPSDAAGYKAHTEGRRG